MGSFFCWKLQHFCMYVKPQHINGDTSVKLETIVRLLNIFRISKYRDALLCKLEEGKRDFCCVGSYILLFQWLPFLTRSSQKIGDCRLFSNLVVAKPVTCLQLKTFLNTPASVKQRERPPSGQATNYSVAGLAPY